MLEPWIRGWTREKRRAHILALWPIALGVDELAVYAHLVDLLQTEAVVPQVRLPKAPPVREDELLELLPDLAETVVYRPK